MCKLRVLPRGLPEKTALEQSIPASCYRDPEQQISIIIPALNESARIIPTLLTLQPLRAEGHEVVLVDAGSRDNTLELARELVDQVIEGESGRARLMNLGAQHAWGETLLFLHADCLLPDHADQLIFSALENRDWGCFDLRFSGRQRMLRIVERVMSWRSRLTGIPTGRQGLFMRRALYERVGGFPDIPVQEDIAMSRRLRQIGRPLFLNRPLMTSSRRLEQRGIVFAALKQWSLWLSQLLNRESHEPLRRDCR
ncbi:MAG TPA: glycosyltransferase [Gammaproteobacteria bacterium]|nr:glycosyltransferase [Gammaproteobacteria bacterium]